MSRTRVLISKKLLEELIDYTGESKITDADVNHMGYLVLTIVRDDGEEYERPDREMRFLGTSPTFLE